MNKPASEIIPEYEKAFEWQSDLSTFYYNRLGQLYVNNENENNGFKQKAIDLYTILVEREPENPIWGDVITNLFGSVDEILKFQKEAWEKDSQNEKKAKALASTAIQARNGLKWLVH